MQQRIKDILQQGQVGDRVTVKGWVRTKRELKECTFVNVNDGSTLAGLQVVIPNTVAAATPAIKDLTTGAAAEFSGELVPSPGKNQAIELHAQQIHLWGGADPETYPLQKKRHSFEFLRTIGHLRPRTNTLGAVMRVRNACAMAIHQFFQERGFLWVHTPIITASDCEGAGELFTVTTLDLAQPPKTPEGQIDFSQDFFGRRAYLTVSGQLEAEIMATAFTNVYTFGPTFRAENSNTSRHLAEFWMVEPEMAFCDLMGDMELAEAFLQFVFRYVLDHCPEEMAFFQERIDKSVMATAEQMASQPFARLSYTEAIQVLEKSGRAFEFPVAWGLDLQSEHERYLAEEYCQRPVIVYDYPAAIKAFYMRLNDDGKTVAAMDVLAPKIGEIIGGSQREERFDVLQQRIVSQGLDPAPYWWYLDLRRYGSVPHAGFGLGFERLVQFMTGMDNIRDVIPFPRTPGNAEF
ncbi:asparagine--tRNA ligase [Thermosynechococcus sichuanensis E542]|uniref:Asparagine--tRNA ligase n=1 Tax=Thermosynechococcus sichuanensis E542 TaxID=2016101 RepID=A0A3B7MFN1_9CYAN|nr:asparagine--tRNA ligase [Thermosynechococcus vestitus]AXY68214.1 asparagine--tRNA ligase [Thermosynechococcus vestitus E542]